MGDFLEGAALGAWAEERRAALRRSYLDALLALGDLQLEAGLADAALDTYRRAVREDALWEAAHRGVMRALAQGGRPDTALRHYAELAALRRTELGARPAAATEALRRDLQQGAAR